MIGRIDDIPFRDRTDPDPHTIPDGLHPSALRRYVRHGRTHLSSRPQPAATRPSQAVARNPEIEGEYDPARPPYGGAPAPGVQDAWGKQDLGISSGLDETFSHPVLAGGPRFVASGHHVDE